MKITVKGKEYESAKMVRSKYKLYQETFNKLQRAEELELTDDEAYQIVCETLVELYNNQFTFEDLEEDLEVSELIFNFNQFALEEQYKVSKKESEWKKKYSAKK